MSSPAYRIDGRPVTREAFYANACDPRRSVVVEACAGAGKTWLLVSRILRALLAGASPQEILAITYTRKAAGEMRERLDGWLRDFGAPAADDATRIAELIARGMSPDDARAAAPQLATLHARLLLGGRAVEVRTFHAWFAQLLRAAPLELLDELGLPRELELVEDIGEHLGAVHRRFNAALLQDAALRADHAALVASRGRHAVRRWLDLVLHRRTEIELADRAGTLEGSVPPPAALWPELASLEHPAQGLLDAPGRALLREIVAELLAKDGVRRREAADAIGPLLALTDADPAQVHAALWSAFFTKGDTPKKLGDLPAVDALQQRLQTIAAQLRQHEAHVEHARMTRLARRLLVDYAAYKRQRGLADMADLERCALHLLRDGELAGWVQERLDARVRHLLVDEFQDTSPLQWHALHAWLSAYAGAGGGASGQRPPSVFIVGDPKQSIYRFRRAEPRVFAAAGEFVAQALGGSRLACDHTRRNAPELLAVLNEVFDAAQRAGSFDGFRPHTTEVGSSGSETGASALPLVLRADRRKGAVAPSGGRDSLTTPRREPDEVLREKEAAAVADAIVAAIAGGRRPGDIMVLSRRREPLGVVAQALQAHHVPYLAAEELPLAEAPEALDLVATLDVLASPRHRLSLARALRSPLFGASDDDLIALAIASAHDGDWWTALCRGPHESPALSRAAELLQRWQAAGRALPPHDLLARIVDEGELRRRLVARVPPERRAQALEAVDAVLAQALVLDAGRYATPYGFVRALKRRPLTFAAAARPDAVQLLTVHGAKGLEAELVFVIDTDPEPRNPDVATLLVDWPVDAEHPRCCAFVYSESACPPSLQRLLADERAASDREEYNGLYVAMTRARRQLVLSAVEPAKASRGGPSWWVQLSPRVPAWYAPAGSVLPAPAPAAQHAPLRVLPTLPFPRRADALETLAASAPATPATRLGQAVHRTLEWATGAAGEALERLAAGAATEFGAPAGEVARIAAAILASPQAARFFDSPQIGWAGNEVTLMLDGQPQRIDRLVRLDDLAGPVWWILDYKLQRRPHELPAYREQLRRYRAALQQAQPGEPVRCALIGGNGEVVEVD